MPRMDYHQAKMRDNARATPPQPTQDAEIAKIIAGMGKGPREPLKRIDPNSPEGRAIAARYSG